MKDEEEAIVLQVNSENECKVQLNVHQQPFSCVVMCTTIILESH